MKLGNQLLQKHKVQVGKMGLSGADSLYLAVAVKLASATKQHGVRVILVTSDNALYRSAIDEQEIETFHFWTCNLGCGCISIIPVKGKANFCPKCKKTCPVCRVDICPSTYQVVFKE